VATAIVIGTSVVGAVAGVALCRGARAPSSQVRPGYDETVKVRKAVFPAAGLGTRFLPATKAQPKEMLPLVDKPMIQYVVEEAVASGLSEVIIVTGRGKRAIEDHFDAAFELEYYLNDRGKTEELAQIKTISELASVSYVRQKEPLGLGHAILCARSLVGDEPFAVFLGDDIIGGAPSPCMRQLLDAAERYQAPVLAVERVPRARIAQYGVIAARQVEGRVHEILDLVEKPKPQDAPSDLAIIGRYVLPPEIFEILAETRADARGEIQLTDALRGLRARRPMYAVEFEGRRYDTGDKLGFLKATVEFALARPDLADEFRAYLKALKL
jgi:UTP--glucose-1-phosphate uridylyltransferase